MGRWEWGYETEFSSGQLCRYAGLLSLEVMDKCGYDYWRSPFEPIFVLRTLNRKVGKIPFAARCPVYATVSKFWDKIWDAFEERWGHLFMKNIVYAYRKTADQ